MDQRDIDFIEQRADTDPELSPSGRSRSSEEAGGKAGSEAFPQPL